MEGSVRYLNLRFGSRLCLDGPGRGLNPRPTEYEVGKLATEP
jgi:hypothetical protein